MATSNPFDPEAMENQVPRPTARTKKDVQDPKLLHKHPLSSSTSRHPLTSSDLASVNHNSLKSHHPRPAESDFDSAKMKKMMDEVVEQRRKRAEAEGVAQGARKDAISALEQVAHLRRQLEKAQARINKRDETIASLAAKPADDKLQIKFEELVNRYQASKTKYQTELDHNAKTNATLQSSLDILESKHERQTCQISDLRNAQEAAELENSKLKRELEILRATTSSSAAQKSAFENERSAWVKECDTLKTTVKDTRDEVERVAKEGNAEIESLKAEKESLWSLVQASASACEALISTSVEEEQYDQLQEELLEARLELVQIEGKVVSLRHELETEREEKSELVARLDQVVFDLKETETRLAETIEDKQELSRDLAEAVSRPNFTAQVDDIAAHDQVATQILDLALIHIDLSTTHLEKKLEAYWTELRETSVRLETTTERLQTSEETLSRLQTTHQALQKIHEDLKKAHEPCSAIEAELRADVIRANQAEANAKTEVREVEDEIKRVEERASRDREGLKRVNEVGLRWEAAKVALEEEVDSLRSALNEAYTFEASYNALQEQHNLLLSQYNLSETETHRLIHQNAQLIGHNNSDQKLNYIESIRREMVAVKHELAATRVMLNAANDKVESLTSEVEAYKSIDVPLFSASTRGSGGSGGGVGGLGNSTRTRVVRRQQEGSRLTLNSSRSVGNLRSVSGPAGRG